MTDTSAIRALAERSGVLPRARVAREVIRRRVLVPLRHPRKTAKVNGFTLRVHSRHEYIARQLFLYGCYEQPEIDSLCSLVRPGDIVLDVGANIGLYSVHLSRAVGPSGQVHAFEPDPANVVLLRQNVEHNACTNVVIHPYGLGAVNEQRALYLNKANKGYQSILRAEVSTGQITIELRRGRDVIGDMVVAAMKIDVEGAEPLVLDGFDTWPPVILFEFLPDQLRMMDVAPCIFLQRFIDRGYRLEQIDGARRVPLTKDTMAALSSGSGFAYNLIALS